jgi:hypothetical protein
MTIPGLKSAVEATLTPFKINDPFQGIIYIPALLLAIKKAEFPIRIVRNKSHGRTLP